MPQTNASITGNPQEPEPYPPSPLLFIGQNRLGQWVVRDQRGLRGGLFVSHAEASRFAMLESGRCPQAVVTVPGHLELDMSAGSGAPASGEILARAFSGAML